MTRLSIISRVGKLLTLVFVFCAGLLSILATGNGGSSGLNTTQACTGPGQNVRTGSAVVLDARCSDFRETAPDTSLIDYFWTIESKPADSSLVLQQFLPVSHIVVDVDGEYLVKLTTGTPGSDKESDTMLIVATTGNAQPRVLAGAYQEVAVGDTVALSAVGSDADDDVLSYSWSFNAASLDEPLSSTNTSVSGFVATQETEYLVDMVVNDGTNNSPRDTVSIRSMSSNQSLPVAVAGPDQHVTPGSQVTLSGLGSYSAYDRPLSYQWRILYKPGASTAKLSDPTGAQPQFVADLEGSYIIRLRVDDGINDSSRKLDGVFEDRLVVFARDNQLPIADGGPDREVNTGATINLNASASSDPEAATLTYDWSLYKAPTGSSAILSSLDSVDTQLIPDVNGDYLVRLVVNDGSDDSLPDIVRVSAAGGGASGGDPLTIVTDLPYAPIAAEVQTRILIDNDGSDTLALDSSDDTPPANFDIALLANANGIASAAFSAAPGWTVVSPANLQINEATDPTFILQRDSDAMYYKLIVRFTTLDANFTVQIDNPLQAWRCGLNPADCP